MEVELGKLAGGSRAGGCLGREGRDGWGGVGGVGWGGWGGLVGWAGWVGGLGWLVGLRWVGWGGCSGKKATVFYTKIWLSQWLLRRGLLEGPFLIVRKARV